MTYYAHKTKDGCRQTQLEHSGKVSDLAGEFAEIFGYKDYAEICGKYHDIGKYTIAFQNRLDGSGESYEHSTAGMYLFAIRKTFQDYILAYLIAGHHTGLPDCGSQVDPDSDGTFYGKMNRRKKMLVDYKAYKVELGEPPLLRELPELYRNSFSLHFLMRMLFSALVDADFLDTERFMSNGVVTRDPGESINELKIKLDSHMARFNNAEGELNLKRAQILTACREAAKGERGMYKLTVPTGGGKTLSSLTFAIDHAAVNGLRRVIYVIPYVNIITQTVGIFEKIFGEENVLGHYSAAEYIPKENEKVSPNELAAENWDKRVVVTTNVQFFESLFGSRTSRCRKLHNIAGSVIIFDEAQALPTGYLRPCINAISELVKNYGCSAVLCTATQPSLDSLLTETGVKAHEIMNNVSELYEIFKRTVYNFIGRRSDDEMLELLKSLNSFLCVMNSRAGAKKYYEGLKGEGVFHLSTYMKPEHIKRTLAFIKERLIADKPCRVVSTSLIEAGVDLDFPLVFREEAGLDSIIQAGGRCNREGKREARDSVVTVFRREKVSSRVAAVLAYNSRISEKYDDVSSPEAIKYYFDTLYKESDLDDKKIMETMKSGLSFKTIADKFKLIDNEQMQVLIPSDEIADLCGKLRSGLRSRTLMREAARHMVSLYPNEYRDLRSTGVLTEYGDLAVLEDSSCYDEMTGLKIPQTGNALFDVD